MADIKIDPEFTAVKQYSPETLATAKANAAPGQTAEQYLASRGGVNTAGYYGDTWSSKENLTDAEYATALTEAKTKGLTGAALGEAINAATAKKRGMSLYDYTKGFQGIKPDTASKVVESSKKNPDGSSTVTYTDGTFSVVPAGAAVPAVGTTTSSNTNTGQAERQSAYDLLYSEFSKYGLESLVAPLKGLIVSGASPSEFTIKLRETPEYQKRFAGNAQRVANGLTAIDEATYLAKEDAYQNLMRNYGLPDSYWKPGALGAQEGFTKLIANDVSAVELENRLQTAQQRVVNANPEIAYALKAFYPDITNGDILAYALDPKNALDAINRKVTAAEIGGAALSQGLTTSLGGAEGLAAYGITKNQAQQGYQTIAGVLPRASQLADIYGQQPYNQATAEAEVFGTQGAANAAERRKKLISLETAKFGGSSGVGALGRDKAIYGSTSGQTGQF